MSMNLVSPLTKRVSAALLLSVGVLSTGLVVQPAAAKSRKAPQVAAAPAANALEAELRLRQDADLQWFYAARSYRPLWTTPGGSLDPAAHALLELLETAPRDDLQPAALGAGPLRMALERVAPTAASVYLARAELAISRAFADYVRALRQAPAAEMAYESQNLRPRVASALDVLREAGRAPSLDAYVRQMQWMHPLYAELRRSPLADPGVDAATRQAVVSNLARLRALPPSRQGRHVLVDAASARLWMYENGRPVDSMKVVVGKPTLQTPMIAGYIRHAVLNPYWNVPTDLVQNKIAPNVVRRGVGYLGKTGYEVLSDFTPDAIVIDPATVDWGKVAAGEAEVRVRQLPGKTNAMGKVKYEFPNPLGIYLHDTPDRDLMAKEARQFSSGCIRVEDAKRLGAWLFAAPLPQDVSAPEQKVSLPELVPVYVTYLTLRLENGQVALGPDPYQRDKAGASAFAQAAVAAVQPQRTP